MELLPKTLTRPLGRIGAAAQNALEVARFGGLATEEQPSPYQVISEHRVFRLRRYYPEGDKSGAPPVLLVPPLMLASEIYDVSPQTSGVTLLAARGIDPWLVDFGAPEHEEGGMFCYQAAAYRRDGAIASLITFGSPVDTQLGMPFGVRGRLSRPARGSAAPSRRGGSRSCGRRR